MPPALQYTEGVMRRSSWLWIVLGGVAVIACSSSSAPPALGDCTGNGDGGCSMASSGGSSSSGGSGGDDGGGACGVSATQSQCDQCAGSDCCSALDDCGNSTPCNNILDCFDACTTASCQAGCPGDYPQGASLFDSLQSCLRLKCPVCAQLGTGDPCANASVQCNAGLSCGGLWCTKPCTLSSQCTGLGANSGNFSGQANACRHVSSGTWCFPGCASDSDCTSYFAGTYCLQTTDISGNTVSVCAAGPDGGLD
jgi:hypothetical protein